MTTKRVCLATTALVGLGWIVSSASAVAQTSPAPEKAQPEVAAEVIVTGSSIRGVKPVGSTVLGISQADIQAQGQSQLIDVLKDVPQVVNLGADDARTSPGAAQRAVSNIAGGSSVNLRGIGIEATLTLMDGQRLPAQGGDGRFFDPNSLPILAVQRLEIVPDGASGIYGSDAVAGVVNIIPVTKFDGLETQERYGGADGLNQTEFDALAGKSWSGGNIVVAYEFNRRSSLLASARPDQYVNSPLYGATSNASFPANLVNNPGPPPFAFAGAGPYQFVDASNTGTLTAANRTATAANVAGVQGNLIGVDALPLQERNSGYIHIDQQVNDRVKVFAEGFYTERDFLRRSTAQGETNLTVPGLSAGADANAYSGIVAPVAADYSFLNALGPEVHKGYERSGQGRIGARVDLFGDWVGNIFASAAETVDYAQTNNQINSQALGAAASCVNANQPNGPFAFPGAPVTTCNNPATAFDPFSNLQPGTAGFGYSGASTYQSVLRSLTGFSSYNPTIKQANLNLKADGSFLTLPGGQARLAVGADFQILNHTSRDTGTLSGPTNTELDVVNYAGVNRTIESLFGELYAPIVGSNNAIPLVHSLALSAAVRYDHYDTKQDNVASAAGFSQSFDTVNPKIGLTWEPVKDLQVRASYGTSFRAPVLGDYSYGAPTLGIPFFVTPAVAAALKLPAGCATSPYSCYTVEIQGGQPNLKPESATTYSLGADYKPSWLPGLALSVSYYNIDYKNQIVVPGTGNWQTSPAYALALQSAGLLTANPSQGTLGTFNNTVNGYLSFGNANAVNPALRYAPYVGLPGYLFANHIQTVSLLVNALSVNSGQLQTDGIDYTLRYKWANSLGRFIVADSGTLVLSDNQSLVQGAPATNYLNQINNLIRFRTRGQLGWANDAWTVDAFVNYVNSYDNPGVGTVGSYTTADLSVAYSPNFSLVHGLKNVRIAVDVQNLFDTAPPYTINVANQTAYDSQEANVIGRMVSVTLTQKF